MKKIENGTITNVKGIKATGISAGLKNSGKKDLALIYSEGKAVCAGVFTKNLAKAAPILIDMEHIKNENTQAIVVNSGNANSCTGEKGLINAKKMAEIVAKKFELKTEEVLVQSTGIIGVQLNMDKIENGIDKAMQSLDETGGLDAATAIMTTDTFVKQICYEFEIDGRKVTIAGMAKGSGMIHPNMATMLSFTITDVNIEKSLLQKMFLEVADNTFNMISVDGDTSTNDMACVLANGLSENEKIVNENSKGYNEFRKALYKVNEELAKLIAKDGEGATKLIEVSVIGAKTLKDAKKVSKSVVTSSLFKAAVFGGDPNWGRILCAVGYSEAEIMIDKVSIYLKGGDIKVQVAKNGMAIEFDEIKAANTLKNEKVEIIIELNDGEFNATAWGCDLSYDYVRINAEYHT
ncbi:MAG: bifunctional glutamate N-acetyltransferase/amino-acid acetyltransferase ArgJ [Leptotrichiaceae bacterium]|nr:bifunctional glutamate N-acetyltransferase/amino-acid acetyltransferase ArgJ [Leptotrichiaceae bacterium]MBP6281394.1 bifunctional glutamate N-acetyltransferase/amino-acid acetyltransferase ArgJ [Leptotrichiaceae bacterium]MBP7100853.1 bifunctional glutamate N-acetyltransferase/amino-acid acetyltransferase ArgJ [Leptotrichiaceae bacterium]MBP7725159.1 bifunctional glutamate N-acetyltransferase/amino-acid acetyltransferase ArgJ [Leptotrichiaceae bacterium]MBP9629158.1 bifunctional glutamate N